MSTYCPLCTSKEFKLRTKHEKYSLLICKNCQLGYLSPMPTQKDINKLYGEDYFKNQKDDKHGYIDYKKMENSLTAESKKKIEFIKSFTIKNKLLDVGCGLGFFLKTIKKLNYVVAGNDISAYAQKELTKQKITFFHGELKEIKLPKSEFDILTAWDVFEHIPDVNSAIRAVNKTLKSDGYLFLTTPDLSSFDAKVLGKFWYGYKKIPEHLIFFNKHSIKFALENNGFKVESIKPWGFSRDFEFISKKISLYIPPIGKLLSIIVKALNLSGVSVYLPLTDMIVAAKKVNNAA